MMTFHFVELQVISVAKQYIDEGIIDNILVYDDGIVKGFIRVEGNEIVELYVDYFFQNQSIGSALIEYAKAHYPITFLWAIEKKSRCHSFLRGTWLSLNRHKEI